MRENKARIKKKKKNKTDWIYEKGQMKLIYLLLFAQRKRKFHELFIKFITGEKIKK